MADEIMSFTTAHARATAEAEAAGGTLKLIEFTVDDEVFEATPLPPGGALLDAAAVAGATSNVVKMQLISKFLDAVLTDESAQRFADRMHSGSRPIDLTTAAQIVAQLVQQYAGRPTVPSSP